MFVMQIIENCHEILSLMSFEMLLKCSEMAYINSIINVINDQISFKPFPWYKQSWLQNNIDKNRDNVKSGQWTFWLLSWRNTDFHWKFCNYYKILERLWLLIICVIFAAKLLNVLKI